jgi:hypothetical protein
MAYPHEIVRKAKRIVDSCETQEQLWVAINYLHLAQVQCRPRFSMYAPPDILGMRRMQEISNLHELIIAKLKWMAEKAIRRTTRLKKRRTLIKKVRRLGFLPGGRK